MEEPGAPVRGGEDHLADAQRLGPAEVALSTAAAPEPVHGFGDGTEVCRAPEARLSTDADGKGSDFALGLDTPVEFVSYSLQGRRFQLGQEMGSSSEQRVMDMEEQKEGSLAPAASAENTGLQTCLEANGRPRLLDKALPYPPCSEAVCSEDARCVYGMLEKTAEGSQFEHVGLTGNGDGCRFMVGVVKETIEELQTACNGAKRGYEGLPVSMNHGSEQEPRGVGSTACVNDELQPDGLISDIEAVSKPAHEHSVPSTSGSIDLSLDLKAGQFGGISGDSGTCHEADRGMCNDDLVHENGDSSNPGKDHLGKLPSGAEGLTLIADAVGGSDHLDQGLSSVNFTSNANDGESQKQNLTALHAFIRRNPKRAASSRNLTSEKQDQIGKGSSGSRNPKKG